MLFFFSAFKTTTDEILSAVCYVIGLVYPQVLTIAMTETHTGLRFSLRRVIQ